jgi:hypothetical protein
VNGAAAPAPTTSRKSTSDNDTAAAVIVYCVPAVPEESLQRCVALVPDAVNVPVTVWLAASVPPVEPDVVAAVMVKLTNVFAPVIDPAQLAGNVTVPKDKPPPAKVAEVPEMLMVEDAALKVKLVDVVNVTELVPPKVNVDVPRVIERTLLLLLERTFVVILKLPELKEPALTVIVPLDDDKAAPNVHPPPTPSNV